MKPIFTEKSIRESKLGNYTFQVEKGMDKKQIAAKVAQIFGVTVTSVRTAMRAVENFLKQPSKKR